MDAGKLREWFYKAHLAKQVYATKYTAEDGKDWILFLPVKGFDLANGTEAWKVITKKGTGFTTSQKIVDNKSLYDKLGKRYWDGSGGKSWDLAKQAWGPALPSALRFKSAYGLRV